jgi:hypothetical protein
MANGEMGSNGAEQFCSETAKSDTLTRLEEAE